MKPNKEGYWIFRGEIVRVSETWKDRFIFHKFRNNLDYDVVETKDSDWGQEITMEPLVKKSELVSEIRHRMNNPQFLENGAYSALRMLLEWVKNK